MAQLPMLSWQLPSILMARLPAEENYYTQTFGGSGSPTNPKCGNASCCGTVRPSPSSHSNDYLSVMQGLRPRGQPK
jgi:hypothetical protein